MDIEKTLEGRGPADLKPATRPEKAGRLRKEYALISAVMQIFEQKGVDATRWGITREEWEETVTGPDGEPVKRQVVKYNGATFVVQELYIDELKKAAEYPGAAGEVEQIKRALVKFGKMDLQGSAYEVDYILSAGGSVLHQLLLAASNAILWPGGAPEPIFAEMSEALSSGKFL